MAYKDIYETDPTDPFFGGKGKGPPEHERTPQEKLGEYSRGAASDAWGGQQPPDWWGQLQQQFSGYQPPAGGQPGGFNPLLNLNSDPALMEWMRGYQYHQPTAAEQHWNAASGKFASGPEKANFLEQLFGQMWDPTKKSATEEFYGTGAGLDPYYDYASKTGGERLGNRMRATGFGGSAHADALSDYEQGLAAEQANREADFNLRSAMASDQGRLGRVGLGITGADAIDRGSRADDALALDYLTEGTRAAATADTSGLNQDIFESGTAKDLDDEARERAFGIQDRNLNMATALFNALFGGASGIAGADAANLDAEMNARTGGALGNYQIDRQGKSDFNDNLALLTQLYTAFSRGGAPSAGGGGGTTAFDSTGGFVPYPENPYIFAG